MIKNKIGLFTLGILLSVSLACTKDFDALNINPNKIDKVTPGSLVTPTVYGMAKYFTVRSYGFTWELMQVGLTNPSIANGIHRYDVTENSGNGTWNTCYKYLRNVREMEVAAEKYNAPVYKAVATTLKAYIVGILTDSFGDIPLSEALMAEEGQDQPQFDNQEAIYTAMILALEEANKVYAMPGTLSGNDLLYNNDKNKWRKFNNSLLMRYYLRLSKRNGQNSYTKIKVMLSDAANYPVFSNNNEAAMIKISGIAPYDYAWGRRQDYVNFEAMSEFFVETLNGLNDPRRALFMTQASRLVNNKITPIGYKGIPSAHSGDESQFDYSPSTPNGDLMFPNTVGTNILQVLMPYSEIEFIKAEVYLQSNMPAEAKTAYENGTKAAITQYGGVVPTNYFDQSPAKFNASLEQIITQKYLALFMVDYQQWFEYRRTGFPVLPKTQYMLHDGKMPTRFMYHNDVRRFNPQNYKIAVDRMGGDNIHTKVWWEK